MAYGCALVKVCASRRTQLSALTLHLPLPTGADAFTTAGSLKKRIASGGNWQQRYAHPAQGTYVKDAVAQRLVDLPASLVSDGSGEYMDA